jgi:hypothetical protein
LLRTQFLVEELLPQGRLDGWFPWWHYGFPLFQLYHPLFFYFTAGLHYATMGALGVEGAFKLAVVLAYALAAPGMYFLLRSLGLSRAGAFAGGFFALLAGNVQGGGLVGTFYIGLIPNAFGLALAPLTVGLFHRAVVTRGERWGLLAGAALGLLVLAHVYTAFTTLLALAVYLAVRWREDPKSLRALGGIALRVLGVALAVSAMLWLSVLGGYGGHGQVVDIPEFNLAGALAESLPGLSLVGDPFVLLFGLAGAALALRRRSLVDSFLLGTVALLLVLGSGVGQEFLPFGDFLREQHARILGSLGLWGAGLAALAFEEAVRQLGRARGPVRAWRRPAAFALVGALLLSGALLAGRRAEGYLSVEADHPAVADVRAAAEWLARNTPAHARIAEEEDTTTRPVYGSHLLLRGLLPLYGQRRLVGGNYPEGAAVSRYTQNFSRPLLGTDEGHTRRLLRFGVTHVVSYREGVRTVLSYARGYRQVFASGNVTVFELAGALPAPVRAEGVRVRSYREGSERVEFEVDSPDGAPLTVLQGHHPGWRGAVDGQPVVLAPSEEALTNVPLPGPGVHRVALRYEQPFLAMLGQAVSFLALLGTVVMLLGAGRRPARVQPESLRRGGRA